MTPRGTALLIFVVLAGLAGLEVWRLGNPRPVSSAAPADQFSASRAIAALHTVWLDAPHPMGTPAHDEVRDRVAAALKALDYQVDIQHTFACNSSAVCGSLDNVIARIPGRAAGGKAVVVAAHYDSVPAGPGASDDGTGVASALEIARAIRREPLTNPVVFLIDDGEETGRLGAEGFIADASRSADAAFIINLEARGTTGSPFLFETSRDNAWLVPAMARELPHPITTSLFATIYEQLPNDTDLTVFKRANRAGINFAYLGGATQYHTPLDNFADIDAGSVQRRGDQALAMVRAFAAAPIAPSAGDAVWFDVFAAYVVWWPVDWSLWIAAGALGLTLIAMIGSMRRGQLTLAGALLGIVSFAVTAILAGGLGFALSQLFALRQPTALYVPYPEAMLAAGWLIGLAAALAASGLARRWASFESVFAGHAIAWNGLAIAIAVLLPGAAYVAVVPGAIMALFALLRALVRLPPLIAALASLIAASAVLFPFALIGYDALSAVAVPVAALLLGLTATTFAPLLAETSRGLIATTTAFAVVAAVIAMLVPTHSALHPLHMPLAYVADADAHTARWQAEAPTPELRVVAAFAPSSQPIAPWYGSARTVEVAPAASAVLSPPAGQVAATPTSDGRQLTVDVTSSRQAPRLSIVWHSANELVSLRINGVTPPPRSARFHSSLAAGWHRIVVDASSAHIEIVERGTSPDDATISDISFGLPPAGAPLVQARNASGGVPVHDGDVTIVQHHLTW